MDCHGIHDNQDTSKDPLKQLTFTRGFRIPWLSWLSLVDHQLFFFPDPSPFGVRNKAGEASPWESPKWLGCFNPHEPLEMPWVVDRGTYPLVNYHNCGKTQFHTISYRKTHYKWRVSMASC